MEGWNKLSSSLSNLNLGQSTSKFTKSFTSSVQATREKLGQISPEDITQLPAGTNDRSTLNLGGLNLLSAEYKELEARVDALRQAHLTLLK